MFNIKINQDGLDEMYAMIGEKIKAALEPVAQEYAGRPAEEVRPAVDAALTSIGVEGDEIRDTVAASISAGEDVEIDLI
ncbi:hypothetical protein PV646_34100 [Streptomyces sp. ID05-26A]|nr:hypothetical protein [Streptomyces sp. ID05-26A]